MQVAVNSAVNWFQSPYYHLFYFSGDAPGFSFADKLLKQLQPPVGARILVAPCRTGKFAAYLSKNEFDITGTDLYADNIARAHELSGEHLQFYQHDLRLPFWINYFHYAFNLFTGLGHYHSQREDQNAIRTLAQSLRPGGLLAVDYPNLHYTEDHLTHTSEKRIGNVHFSLTEWFDETHFNKKITVIDNELQEPLEFFERTAKYSLGDFNDMFAFYDLQVQEVFGDYELGKYDIRNSPRLIMLAKKKS